MGIYTKQNLEIAIRDHIEKKGRAPTEVTEGAIEAGPLKGKKWTWITKALARGVFKDIDPGIASLGALKRSLKIPRKGYKNNTPHLPATCTRTDIENAIRNDMAKNKGKPPSAGSKTITTGPLQGVRWMSVHVALYEGRIQGVPENIRSFGAFKQMMGISSTLVSAWRKAQPRINATDVYQQCKADIARSGMLPHPESKDPLVQSLSAREIAIAFQCQAVQGIEDVVQDPANLPYQSPVLLYDFLIASGLAVKDNLGRVLPAPIAMAA